MATVRLNRPEAMNSLDIATKDALVSALTEVAEDPSVRCVVLTGSGRAFCVGQDLREHITLLQNDDPSLWDTVARHYNPVVELLATMNKPVVAAVNGVAAGAGAGFALAADFRVMVDTAGFNLAFAGIALSCDSGTSWSLQRFVGPAKAKELLLLPRTVPAEECLSLGLVTTVVPPESSRPRWRAGHDAGRGADARLRLDPPRRRVQRRSRPERLTGQRGRLHDADRRDARPPRGRRRVPRQGEAGLHRRVTSPRPRLVRVGRRPRACRSAGCR